MTGPNPACYCADDDWNNMAIIPSMGEALNVAASAQSNAGKEAGVVKGVTRMLYGSIPSSWGRKANGNLAAWHSSLTSV